MPTGKNTDENPYNGYTLKYYKDYSSQLNKYTSLTIKHQAKCWHILGPG